MKTLSGGRIEIVNGIVVRSDDKSLEGLSVVTAPWDGSKRAILRPRNGDYLRETDGFIEIYPNWDWVRECLSDYKQGDNGAFYAAEDYLRDAGLIPKSHPLGQWELAGDSVVLLHKDVVQIARNAWRVADALLEEDPCMEKSSTENAVNQAQKICTELHMTEDEVAQFHKTR